MSMTPRQRKETVFQGGIPDQMVWFADLTYWYDGHRQIGDVPDDWQGEGGMQRMHQALGAGRYVPGAYAFRMQEGDGVEVRSRHERDEHVVEWQTPLGTLSQTQIWCPDSFSWAFRDHPVKSVEDLRIVRYIEERRTYVPDPAELLRLEREYRDFGLPHAATRPSPMFELYKSWVGALDLIYLLADEDEEVMKTVACLAESMRPLYQITAEAPCGYVMLCENLTAETMGGLFDLHSRDYLTEQIELLHRHGKKVMIHIDGTLRGLVEKLPAIGVDCLDAVTPLPVGDVGLDEIRALVGDEMLIL
ncbi:MAG TPA: hypothetical protein VGL77_21045, partial [Armatimonadota bacterium]